jgi:Fanconi-associated nuclease 1
LGVLKEYSAELEVIDSLLGQRRWRRGKRGGWHERKACILMTHCGKDKATMERAMQAVIDGLNDDDTHISESYGPSRDATPLK